MLEEVKARGLPVVDDGSVKDSAGGQIASTIGLDFATADVRIDAVPSPDDIDKALASLEAMAKEKRLGDRHRQRQAQDHQAALEWAGQAPGQGHRPDPGQRGHPLAASKLILIP